MNYLGEEGYERIVDTMMRTAARLREGIDALPGLRVLGQPDMCVMAIGGDGLDVYEVGDEMQLRGWHLDRQQFPPSLHLTVTYVHAGVVERFLADLRDAVRTVRRPSARRWLNGVVLRLVRLLTRLLPEKWVSRLTQRAGAGAGSSLSGRSAPMYGMMAALPNRGDVDQIVLDALDGLTRVS
jgi:hypothetical protein